MKINGHKIDNVWPQKRKKGGNRKKYSDFIKKNLEIKLKSRNFAVAKCAINAIICKGEGERAVVYSGPFVYRLGREIFIL